MDAPCYKKTKRIYSKISSQDIYSHVWKLLYQTALSMCTNCISKLVKASQLHIAIYDCDHKNVITQWGEQHDSSIKKTVTLKQIFSSITNAIFHCVAHIWPKTVVSSTIQLNKNKMHKANAISSSHGSGHEQFVAGFVSGKVSIWSTFMFHSTILMLRNKASTQIYAHECKSMLWVQAENFKYATALTCETGSILGFE